MRQPSSGQSKEGKWGSNGIGSGANDPMPLSTLTKDCQLNNTLIQIIIAIIPGEFFSRKLS